MNRRSGWLFVTVGCLVASCSQDPVDRSIPDRGGEIFADTGVRTDMRGTDASSVDATVADIGLAPCEPPPPAPTAPLQPVLGELYYEQVGLGGFAMGESAILVGGDGGVMLVDVGNDSHSDDVLERLQALGRATVTDIVVTHFHADHGDGLSEVVERTGIQRSLVHRGLTDRTNAANDATMDELADVAAQNSGVDLPLCDDSGCAALGTTRKLGETTVRFIGANATMAGERYEASVGPLDTEDGNGENARSVVGVVEHGLFRLMFTGDLTGGGSDTDDVESFYATRLADVCDIDERGVDVLHAGHHGRNTSSNATWVGRLTGSRDHNVVMGVSTAHLRSPHREILDAFAGHLGEGRIWTTRVATGGAQGEHLVSAGGGRIVIATMEGGDAYAVQAIGEDGAVIASSSFRAVRGCSSR